MMKLIAAIVAFLGSVGKFFMERFSADAKRKRKAVKDGKKYIKDGDTSGITATLSKLRNK